MKLSEYRNEEAAEKLIVLLDMVEPLLKDTEVMAAMKSGTLAAAKAMLKTHPKEIIDILAYVDGIQREKYTVSPVGILKRLIRLLNDDDTSAVFTSEGQVVEG
jgi:hypothetical protein